LIAFIAQRHIDLKPNFAVSCQAGQQVGAGFALLADRLPSDADLTARSLINGFLRFAFDETSLYRLIFSLRASALLAEPPANRFVA
jgi:hypothetical protein